ncbi:phosphate/phosphite/phosphonate ABC transporter substrate-binding protein [Luteimonas pelagia]
MSSSRIAACLLGLLAVLAPLLPARAQDDGHVLVIGRISDDPKAHYRQLKGLLDYVVPRMADVGIREGRILMARDAQQMASFLRRGRVDWVTETAATGVMLQERAAARPLLLTERDGVSRYHTVFFSRRDSGVDALSDLPGHSVAFQRPNSTSAYFVPAAEMLSEGLVLEPLLSPVDRPDAPVVGYLFARSELNVATWVHKGLVDAGAVSNLDWANPQRMPPAFRDDLQIIARSGEYPRAIELVRGDLDPRVANRLREVLLEAAGDPDAHEALMRFFRTTRFLPLDGDADRSALDRVGQGVRRVRSEVE